MILSTKPTFRHFFLSNQIKSNQLVVISNYQPRLMFLINLIGWFLNLKQIWSENQNICSFEQSNQINFQSLLLLKSQFPWLIWSSQSSLINYFCFVLIEIKSIKTQININQSINQKNINQIQRSLFKLEYNTNSWMCVISIVFHLIFVCFLIVSTLKVNSQPNSTKSNEILSILSISISWKMI